MNKIKIELTSLTTETSDENSNYSGFYVIASFPHRTNDGLMSGGAKVELDIDGKGILYLPPNGEIENDNISLEVFNRYGVYALEKQIVNETIFNEYRNKDKVFYITNVNIDNNLNTKNTYYKVKGRIIDLKGEQKFSKYNYFVVKLSENIETNSIETIIDHPSSEIIVNANTDMDGYFSFDVKHEKSDFYYALIVPKSIEKWVSLKTEKEYLDTKDKAQYLLKILDKQIFALTPLTSDNVNDGKETSDCGCESTESYQTSEEFGRAESGKVSQQLSGCFDLTKPNQSVEEYLFYQAVRITDPAIKKVNVISKNFTETLSDLENLLNNGGAFTEDGGLVLQTTSR
jgi:hypothetical protein